MRRIESEADIREGLAHLASVEPRFAPVIGSAGEVPLRRSLPGFEGLARTIVSQQLSVASAKAIWMRVTTRFPELRPTDILAASEIELRACGLSGPKLRTLQALAEAVAEGRLDFARLDVAPDREVTAAMTAVKGIGPWTADIYMMFDLGRADVFAPGDLALQEALRIGFALPARPTTRELALMAEPWSPWRAVAARLLWAYYHVVKVRAGIDL